MSQVQAAGSLRPSTVGSRPVDEHGFEQRTHREILLVMSGLMIAMLLAMLDNTIVAPALPTIVGDLGGLKHLSWVITAYILGTTVATPLWGKLGDLFSRKTVFMASIVLFLAGSALCGMAQNMGQLIGFRAFQGVGAGGLMTGVMSVMAVLIPPRDRGKYTGYFMAIMPVSMIAGPLVGGWITDNASWRWAFYVNVPVGAVALFVIAATMHLPKPAPKKVTIDWLGAALQTIWITALVLVTSWGGTQYGWGSPVIIVLIVLAALTFVGFLRTQLTVAEPIMPLGVFRNLNFSLATGLSFVVGFGMFGAMTFLPQFQQYVQGASATSSGLLLLPMMGGIVITSLTAGQVSSRTGHYRTFPILGTILMTAGLALLATMNVNASRTVTGIWMFVLGLGMGMLFQITMLVAQNSVSISDIGAATSAVTFLRSMGGSIGVSLLGSLYAHRLAETVSQRLGQSNPLGSGAALSPAVVRQMPPAVRDALAHGITHGISAVFLWGAVVASAGIVIGLFIKQVPLRGLAPAGARAVPAQPAADAAAATAGATVAAVPIEPPAANVPAHVGGRVAERDGRGLAGATVTVLDLTGNQIARGAADETGVFGLELPWNAPGQTLVVGAVGFEPAVRLIGAGPHHEVVLDALPPRLFGRVHGIDEGEVAVLSALDGAGVLLARTTTRSGGRFAIGGLPDGQISLVIQAPGFAPRITEVQIGAEAAGWVEVHLAAGNDTAVLTPPRKPEAGVIDPETGAVRMN